MLPETDPRITGGRARYQINDRVNVNCTSGRSKPAVKLTWFINGQHAGPEYVKQYKTFTTGREGLEQTILGLRFRVRHEHFKHGDMKLKVIVMNFHRIPISYTNFIIQCLGVIESVYWKSNEESVMGDKQKASLLEVKKPVSATSISTRADRVHGKFNLMRVIDKSFKFSSLSTANMSKCLKSSLEVLVLSFIILIALTNNRLIER